MERHPRDQVGLGIFPAHIMAALPRIPASLAKQESDPMQPPRHQVGRGGGGGGE